MADGEAARASPRPEKRCDLCGYRAEGPKARGIHWLHRLGGWACSRCYFSPRCDPGADLAPLPARDPRPDEADDVEEVRAVATTTMT